MDTYTPTPLGAPREVRPDQLAWLRHEIPLWQDAGLVSAPQASAILGSYHERSRLGVRLSLGRILLALGGGFVGIGLIWLVAANLDRFSPSVRFAFVAVLWLALLAGGEALAARGTSRPVVGAVRLMAALAFGATIFQAAQSLQVPAYEPTLMGVWAAGALLHAHVTRAFMPLLVGVGTGLFWWIAQPLWTDASGLTVVVVFGLGAVTAAGLAVVSDAWKPSFAWLWRLVAAGLALVTLFAAAIPDIGNDDIRWSGWLIAEAVAAAVVGTAAVVLRRGTRALEPVGAAVTLLVAFGIASWTTGTDTDNIDASDWGHAIVSVGAYVLLAVVLVALGTIRDHPAITWLAMAGLVVFTTFQSFAVFAPIVTGAWLFVVLGTVFLATGFLFDRARRELQQVLETDTDSPEGAPR
ncbi:MAG: DUF2157 domain-containing protein [Nocardioides sp.]|nr:DUF2157 domain-containing protein [Nocardioides sp.]